MFLPQILQRLSPLPFSTRILSKRATLSTWHVRQTATLSLSLSSPKMYRKKAYLLSFVVFFCQPLSLFCFCLIIFTGKTYCWTKKPADPEVRQAHRCRKIPLQSHRLWWLWCQLEQNAQPLCPLWVSLRLLLNSKHTYTLPQHSPRDIPFFYPNGMGLRFNGIRSAGRYPIQFFTVHLLL